MWYEILPGVAIIFAGLYAPHVANWGINYLFQNGKTTKRNWEAHPQDFRMYLRDQRLTGSEYKPRGLEGISSEPPKNSA